jgi:DNA polymerase III epsilon subunit-like protein
MQEQEWIILDTETTGLMQPIYTLEIAAQRMRGLEPVGEIFQIYLNHVVDIPFDAQQVHGYSKQFLAKHGVPPLEAHRAFSEFANNAPICAYNLPYDYGSVLRPEWQRLQLPELSPRGFCMMQLSKKILTNTVIQKGPGQFKLQSLKERFKLPDRAAHSASGDVLAVIDLLEKVLHPRLQELGLTGYASIKSFTDLGAYPDVLNFGEFKGRGWREAGTDSELHDWLKCLAEQSTANGAAMANWCLKKLNAEKLIEPKRVAVPSVSEANQPPRVIKVCSSCKTQFRIPATNRRYVSCPKCKKLHFVKA